MKIKLNLLPFCIVDQRDIVEEEEKDVKKKGEESGRHPPNIQKYRIDAQGAQRYERTTSAPLRTGGYADWEQ